jgi:hypothetical protein
MMSFKKDHRHPLKKADLGWLKISLGTRITILLLLGILSYICINIVGDANLAQRRVFIRYWNCLVCVFFSIAAPHLIFPDADLSLIQMINLDRKQLLKHQFRKFGIALIVVSIPAIIIVFYDLENMIRNIFGGIVLIAESWLFVFGIICYAFQKFASIGQRSQDWREGKRGKLFRRYLKIHPERVPTMLATASTIFWGMHLVVFGAYLSHIYQFDFEWLPGLLLLIWAFVRTSLKMKAYDRHFYCTNAFYKEAFKDIDVPKGKEDESVTYSSLYWAPHRWSPYVWAGLLQMDRRLPLAVFMVLGHILLWVLFYFQTAEAFITAYLLLFIIAKNSASYLLITPSAAPIHFQITLQSSSNWVITRFFINFRWTFLFIVNLPLIAWIWDSFTFLNAIKWISLDLFLAFLSALLFTYFHEIQFKIRVLRLRSK